MFIFIPSVNQNIICMAGKNVIIWEAVFWKCSLIEDMPHGSQFKQWSLNVLMNIITGIDSIARVICQKPAIASNFENTLLLLTIYSQHTYRFFFQALESWLSPNRKIRAIHVFFCLGNFLYFLWKRREFLMAPILLLFPNTCQVSKPHEDMWIPFCHWCILPFLLGVLLATLNGELLILVLYL